MLFRKDHWAGLTDGTITLAFRRWTRPNAVAGRRMRFVGGYLKVDDVRIVDESKLTKADARRAGFESVDTLRAELAKGRRRARPTGSRCTGTAKTSGSHSRADDDVSEDELATIEAKLARLDKASTRGPWTQTTLTLISENPGVRAPDLAASLGLETLVFKRDVRKLKALGLTESLTVGYRISPRGLVLLAREASPTT